MKTVSLKLTEGLERKLATKARKRGTTKSDLIRQALRVYFASEDDPTPGSCLDLAADLFGCVEGPPDLSSNKERLEGFGA